MSKANEIPGIYIYHALKDKSLNGDAYLSEETLYAACKEVKPVLTYDMFRADLLEQFRRGYLYREGRRIYSTKTWRYEEETARKLSHRGSRRDPRHSSA